MRSELAAAVERLVSLLGAELPRPLCGRARRRRHVAAVHGTDELVTQVQPAQSKRVGELQNPGRHKRHRGAQIGEMLPKPSGCLAIRSAWIHFAQRRFLFGKGLRSAVEGG